MIKRLQDGQENNEHPFFILYILQSFNPNIFRDCSE